MRSDEPRGGPRVQRMPVQTKRLLNREGGEFPRYIIERFCNAITSYLDRTLIHNDRKRNYLWRIRTED